MTIVTNTIADTGRGSNDVLGFDIGGTFIKWVRVAADGSIGDRGSMDTSPRGPDQVARDIAALASGRDVAALGVAVPGHLTEDLRGTSTIPNAAGQWQDYRLVDVITELSGTRVTLTNDARAFALAELSLGAARGLTEVLFVTIGTGIGGAVALGGHILRGPRDMVGEIGHTIVDPSGAVCGCGARGCLETVAGGRAIATAWSNITGDPSTSTPKSLVAAARHANPAALEILGEAGRALGVAIGSTLAFLGFRHVVLGGGVAPAFEFMRAEAVRELTRRHPLVGEIDIRIAELGTEAGAVGAALAARAVGRAAAANAMMMVDTVIPEPALLRADVEGRDRYVSHREDAH